MSESLNPYASPRVPSQRNEAFEGRAIVGVFTVDAQTQRDAARGYQIRHVVWLVATLLPLLVMLPFPFLLWKGNPVWLLYSMVGLFLIGSFATVGLHVAIDWSIFWHNLRQLQRHPILGALGPWRIAVDERTIQVSTQRGPQSWPLADVRRMELANRPLVLWLEPDLAIALPRHGDYGEDDYATVRAALRKRVAHIGRRPKPARPTESGAAGG